MADSPYWPIFGLPLPEWLAALQAIEPALPNIDGRIVEIRVLKDGKLGRSGDRAGILAALGSTSRSRPGP
jgi:hypothetical protein